MISRQFLRTVLAVEVVIGVTALASVAVHALGLWCRQHADRPRIDRGLAALAEALTAAPGDDGVWSDRMAELRRLRRRVQRRVVQQLAVAVTSAEGRGVGDVADELGLAGVSWLLRGGLVFPQVGGGFRTLLAYYLGDGEAEAID